MEQLSGLLAAQIKSVFGIEVDVALERTDEQFGDFSTNVAMQLSGRLGKSPREIAEEIIVGLHNDLIDRVEIAGPGFINIFVADDVYQNEMDAVLEQGSQYGSNSTNQNTEILVEFGDPNPFKEMHLGHLYSTIVGDSISRLLSVTGAKVQRLSYHGDIGLHVAKAIYGLQKDLLEKGRIKEINDDTAIDISGVVTTLNLDLGVYYASGAKAFEEDEEHKKIIYEINEHIYKKDNDLINTLYEWGRERSFGYFDQILKEVGVRYDKRYLESQTSEVGVSYVNNNRGSVFEESEGAIVYKGEKVGLHTRVFINSRGLPTYETKDLGLAELKAKDFPNAAKSIVITAHEQSEYFKVMLAALKEIDSKLADMTVHVAHGFLSLTTGKMSSRSGHVYSATNLLWNVEDEIKTQYPETNSNNKTYLAAIKYTFLKNRVGGDIVFDVQESVSLEGNSGPYLQYAHARSISLIRQSTSADNVRMYNYRLDATERSLVRKISEFREVVQKSANELMPHHLCTYLYELAQTFNKFYEKHRVVGSPREIDRIKLVMAYSQVLKNGLELLGIQAPEKM